MSKTVEIKMTLPAPPEGYEYTGEMRQARDGEWFVDYDGVLLKRNAERCTKGTYPILRKKRWRADHGCFYFFVADDGLTYKLVETAHEDDKFRWEVGNYFQTMLQAEEVAAKFRELLKEMNP